MRPAVATREGTARARRARAWGARRRSPPTPRDDRRPCCRSGSRRLRSTRWVRAATNGRSQPAHRTRERRSSTPPRGSQWRETRRSSRARSAGTRPRDRLASHRDASVRCGIDRPHRAGRPTTAPLDCVCATATRSPDQCPTGPGRVRHSSTSHRGTIRCPASLGNRSQSRGDLATARRPNRRRCPRTRLVRRSSSGAGRGSRPSGDLSAPRPFERSRRDGCRQRPLRRAPRQPHRAARRPRGATLAASLARMTGSVGTVSGGS